MLYLLNLMYHNMWGAVKSDAAVRYMQDDSFSFNCPSYINVFWRSASLTFIYRSAFKVNSLHLHLLVVSQRLSILINLKTLLNWDVSKLIATSLFFKNRIFFFPYLLICIFTDSLAAIHSIIQYAPTAYSHRTAPMQKKWLELN